MGSNDILHINAAYVASWKKVNPKLYDLFMNKLTLEANLSGHFKNEHVDLSLFK